jgi:RecA-family ATPase
VSGLLDESYQESLVKLGEPDRHHHQQANVSVNWLIKPALWEGQPVPQREWIVPQYIPHPTVTLLCGNGSVGKSLLALQLGVGRALAREWIGLLPEPGRTIYFSAEDDADEMHRRLDGIRRFHCAPWADIGDGLRLRDNVGADAILCGWGSGVLKPTAVMLNIIAHIDDFAPELVIIDTLADAYPGDENDRCQARQFVGMLKQVSRTRKCSFLVLAHPSLSGLNTGRETSGSTGWSNSVRSRLYFQISKASDGSEPDKNLRTLEGMKSNYGAGGGKIDLEWNDGLFVPVDAPAGLDRMAAEAKAEDVFLAILKHFNITGRNAGIRPGTSYAPALFADQPDNQGVGKKQFETAMNRLLADNKIAIAESGPDPAAFKLWSWARNR